MSQFARDLTKEILYKEAERHAQETVNTTAKIMLDKNLVASHDRFKLTDPNFLKACVSNYSMESQVSMRCPECLIDIYGSREMMKMHAKKHHEQDNKRENEMKVLKTRMHFT